MASYHANVRVLSRSKGESAVAAAAYRVGAAMKDMRTGAMHDYSKKTGVMGVHLLAPPHAPSWAADATTLWNQAEGAEVRCNARTAREIIFCLPHELAESVRTALAVSVMREVVERYEVAAMVAIHAPDTRGDQRNFHAHLLFTTRVMTPAGFGKKVLALDDRKTGPEEVRWLREKVGELTNGALASAGVTERVDHRTLAAQAAEAEALGDFDKAARLTREPTKHVGRSATAAVRRGLHSSRVAHNQAVIAAHERALDAYMARAKAEGRLMPMASDARPGPRMAVPKSSSARTRIASPPAGRTKATGRDAAVLNAQAAQREASDRASREASESYLAGLRQSERDAETMRATSLRMSAAESHRAALVEAAQNDSEMKRLLAELDQAQRNLAVLRTQAKARRARYAKAQEERAAQQKAEEADRTPPARWRLVERQRWEKMRRARWGKLRDAIQAEQQAREATGPAAIAEQRKRAADLRQEVDRLDRELARRLGGLPEAGPVPPRQPTAPPRPASPRPR